MAAPFEIPLSVPFLGGNEERYLQECVRTGWVSSVGPFVDRFEEEFARVVGAQHAIACASGTAALHLAMRLLGVQPVIETDGDNLGHPADTGAVLQVLRQGADVVVVQRGDRAAYGLVRMRYRVSLGAIGSFAAGVVVAVVVMVAGAPWQVGAVAGFALFLLLLNTLARRSKRAVGNDDIAFWMISQRMLPPVAVVIPIYIFFQQLQLLDTWAALIIAYVASHLPIVVWLMRDYFQSIPVELEESAAIDGASPYRIFRSIVLPLSVPGLVATFLFVLVFAWNEYLIALFLTSANAQTLPLTVAAQNATRGPQWWYMSVLILIMIGPVIAMAIALERFIARGLLVGAVKG